MKKVLSILIMMALAFCLALPAEAAGRIKIIDSVTLDDSPTTTVSSVVNVESAEKVGFFLDYDETEVGNAVQGRITIETSYDGSTWIGTYFIDQEGGDASWVSEEYLTGDQSYFFWLPDNMNYSRARVRVTGTNTDSDDTIVVDCWAVLKQ